MFWLDQTDDIIENKELNKWVLFLSTTLELSIWDDPKNPSTSHTTWYGLEMYLSLD